VLGCRVVDASQARGGGADERCDRLRLLSFFSLRCFQNINISKKFIVVVFFFLAIYLKYNEGTHSDTCVESVQVCAAVPTASWRVRSGPYTSGYTHCGQLDMERFTEPRTEVAPFSGRPVMATEHESTAETLTDMIMPVLSTSNVALGLLR
jgi:hypothetical protein